MSSSYFPWGRILGAIALGEIIPIAFLVLFVFLYGITGGALPVDVFAREAGMWVGPIVGSATCFVLARWVGRRAPDRALILGLTMGIGVAIVDVALLIAQREALVPLVWASNAMKIVAGWLGGRTHIKWTGGEVESGKVS